jgi:putative peptide zinc metalloprotease protein
MSEKPLFHESWHRIAGEKISLRKSARVVRQMFRGSKWYVVEDPFSNQYYRMRPAAYEFVARLRPGKTVDEVWQETIQKSPSEALGQSEIVDLLAQLYHANLLQYSPEHSSAELFERHKQRKNRMLKATLMNIMFFRIPLFDPNNLLTRLDSVIRLFLGPLGAVVWIAAFGVLLKFAIDGFPQLQTQSRNVLAPQNLALLYLGMAIIKTWHEFGHACAVRRFRGEVHTMGVMFLIFSPLPYVDASSAWAFRNRWHRVLVGSAGMLFELVFASAAMVVWTFTGEGTLHALAYNMIFVGSVSTLLFNLNPLLRYDGYYILCDLIGIPNLHQLSRDQLQYLMERYAFRRMDARSPAANRQEAAIVTAFGILSNVYRIFLFSGILFFIADRLLILGVILACVCGVAWVIIPIGKFVKYLLSNPQLERVRPRAIGVSAAFFAFCIAIFGLIPFPSGFTAPGVVKAGEYRVVTNGVDGRVTELLAPFGARVKKGDPLLRLENPELGWEKQEALKAVEEAEARLQNAMNEGNFDIKPLSSRLEFDQKKLDRIMTEENELVVKAEIDGQWISPEADAFLGSFIGRGTPLGELVSDDSLRFVSVVAQENISQIFSDAVVSTEVRVRGQAGRVSKIISYKAIPMDQKDLPSSALGWNTGGEVAVDANDKTGRSTTEPFYEVRAQMAPGSQALLRHGQSGKIRFKVHPEPLLVKWSRKLRQLVQKRYQV